jgi:hypothetical protein
MNQKKHTNDSASTKKPNDFQLLSTRAEELIGELDTQQVLQLYKKLQLTTYSEWQAWLFEERDEIARYDCLGAAERKRRIHTPDPDDALLLQYACVYVELWRACISQKYFCFPPSGDALETPAAQRRAMLDIVASYDDPECSNWWPFDHEAIGDPWPFRREP